MDTFESKRKCDYCKRDNQFLIILNKCGFEICDHHFDKKAGERIECPVCYDHQVSLSECMKVSKNLYTMQVKELFKRIEILSGKIQNYQEIRDHPEAYLHRKHIEIFEKINNRSSDLINMVNKQIYQCNNQLKDYYKLKLGKHVRLIKSSLNSINFEQKENLNRIIRQINGGSVKNLSILIQSLNEQVKETESQLDGVDKIFNQSFELDFVYTTNSLKPNIQNIFGRLKFKENKNLGPLNKLVLRKTFEKHQGPVIAVRELLNGNLVSASHDMTLKIWNKDSGECIHSLTNHSDHVKDIQLVGEKLISVSKDKSICVYEMEKFVNRIPSTESINCLSVLENGDLLTGSADGYVRRWNSSSCHLIKEFKAHDKSVYDILSLTPDTLVSCSADKSIKVWLLERENCTKNYKNHTEYVWCLEKVDENKFLSGSKDKKIFLWDINKDNYVFVYEGHTEIVRCLIRKNQEEFLSCSEDGYVIEWNVNSPTPKGRIDLPEKNKISSIFITDDGELVIATRDGYIQLWDSIIS